MGSRVLVIGGDAAGMTAASALRRRLPAEHEVVVLERTQRTSYSACGIPYWVSGEVESVDDLVARSPEEHRANGIDLRTGAEAAAIDVEARSVTYRDADDEQTLDYDRLVIATGAEPRRPDLPGIDAEGIYGIQTLADGEAVIAALGERPRHVVVVGSGYVGLEMAEAMTQRGIDTTVIERGETPLSLLEPSLGTKVADAMRDLGITLRTGTAVDGFVEEDGRVAGVRAGGETYPADLVVLGLGVVARTRLAQDAGLPTGAKGGIVVDDTQRVEGADGVWAAGDCVVTRDRITGDLLHVPLGTHANKQGLVMADAIAADLLGEAPRLRFPGIVRTAITKFCSLEISRTGLGEQQARDAGFDPVVATIDTTTTAGYFPDAGTMTVLMVADRATRRLLGVQVVGERNAGLRIDTGAVAITAEMTVDDVVMLDLAYAPPFASVWSPLQVAAREAVKRLS
ncbi:FAD-dependent oxidoreductase [Aeromicrobium terrae]|uniref:Flavoprotein oxidoreductase n=1 Tax=Aeromicrobium terrae TaxID=2498846 RepID=A0A5C8NC59_9ACTN|nr:FAD-dependent oxidoreductase [Aeromicrobium terrae]TXL56639.1 flavoprotein oxidoreductase [Aeromicrobium terrae]